MRVWLELVDISDLKSEELNARGGSSPPIRTLWIWLELVDMQVSKACERKLVVVRVHLFTQYACGGTAYALVLETRFCEFESHQVYNKIWPYRLMVGQ